MILSQINLIALSRIAEQAALEAGKMIEEVIASDPMRENLQVEGKEAGSCKATQVVTEVDFKSEKLILDILKPTLKKYDLALLTEESVDDKSRLEKDYFWCIDPLDGTLAFTQSLPWFSVSIALVSKKGIPKVGVIYDPSTRIIYSAVYGVEAAKNNSPIVLNKSSDKSLLTIIAEESLIKDHRFREIKKQLKLAGWQQIKIIEGYGAVINACQVLENSPAVYFKLPKEELGGGCFWDFAATSCLFNQLLAPVTDFFGNPLELNKKQDTYMNKKGVIYASDQSISNELITIIQSL